MVEFGSGYFNPMDRDYGAAHENVHGGHDHHGHSHSPQATGDVGVGMGDFGMSLGLGPVPNVSAIGAKLRAGTKTMEFVFTGQAKGQGQAQTPGMYGLKQRQALVEMGKANKIDFTTHATVGVYGLAGMDQQGNFNKESKDFSLQEIKRAVEFAADVGRGGPVVVHTGEFKRPVYDAEWNTQDDQWKDKFKLYEDEPERAAFKVIDTRTGGQLVEARKNRRVARPVWNVAQTGEEYKDFDGTMKKANGGDRIYMDYFGNRLHQEDRVPEYDAENGVFKVHQLTWEDMQKEAKEFTQRAREVWQDWKSGKMSQEDFEKSYWTRFKDVYDENEIIVRPEEAFVIATMETNAANSRGWGYYYGAGFNNAVTNIKKLKKAIEFHEKLEEATDPEERWKLEQEIPAQVRSLPLGGVLPTDRKLTSKILKEALVAEQGQLKQSQEASASQWAQAEETIETIRHAESQETYAQKEAFDSYAHAAIKAMEQSNKLEQSGQLKRPIQIALENLFPETYGAHPEELKHLVLGSRRKMVGMLKQRGMDEKAAWKEANEHITSTFDTGHLNMWRKYWQGDPTKTMQQNDQEFNTWMLEKIGELAKENIIGHVHIDDNYGYHDDHLAPGEGNTPIKEMVETLKKNGYKGEMIIEPGADYTTDVSGFHSVMKTWRMFGSPVYGAGSGIGPGRRGSWGQVQYGWFGQNQPPYFTFGGYSPSEDWTLWSGVPLE